MEKYTIEDVAKALGVSKRTIVNYEKKGILPEPKRSSVGWRIYTQEDIVIIRSLFNDVIKGRKEQWERL